MQVSYEVWVSEQSSGRINMGGSAPQSIPRFGSGLGVGIRYLTARKPKTIVNVKPETTDSSRNSFRRPDDRYRRGGKLPLDFH